MIIMIAGSNNISKLFSVVGRQTRRDSGSLPESLPVSCTDVYVNFVCLRPAFRVARLAGTACSEPEGWLSS